MILADSELYAHEYATCGLKNHDARDAQARATVARSKLALEKSFAHGVCGGRTGVRSGTPRAGVMPANAVELGAAAKSEACRAYAIDEAEFSVLININARRWAVVALSSVPAIDMGINDLMGPKRACRMLDINPSNAADMNDRLSVTRPIQHMRAVAYGKSLAARWGK
jgi:hypothetical protein